MSSVDIERVAKIMRQVAAAEAMPRWRNLAGGDIVEKNGPDDVVTIADRETELALSRELTAMLPGSVVVGEEGVHANPELLKQLDGNHPVWVIDPIDGTSSFAKGGPEFAVMVALVHHQRLEAGWILAPVTGDLICGRRGDGVWRSTGGSFLRVPRPNAPTKLVDMRGITGRRLMSAERQLRINGAVDRFRSIDPAVCAGFEYPKLASGAAEFALYNKSEPWDHLPGLALVAEQGFHFAKHDGTPYLPGDNSGGLLIAPDLKSWTAINELLLR